jgi:hypothetical protein
MKIQDKLKLPDDFIPEYKIIETHDCSFTYAKRYTAKIEIKAGLSQEQIELNHIHAIIEIYTKYDKEIKVWSKKKQIGAIGIFGYTQGDDWILSCTAGMSEFCPFGDWSRAHEKVNLKDYEFKIYFRED